MVRDGASRPLTMRVLDRLLRPHPEEHRFSDASRRMGNRAVFPRRDRARVVEQNPLQEKRAQGTPGARRARSLACKNRKHASKSPRSHRFTRHSLHDGFTAYSTLFPAIGLFVTVPTQCEALSRVDVSVETSEPRGFVVRVTCVRLSHRKRPSHPAPNVRDDRDTPLLRGARRAENAADLPDVTTEMSATD